MDKERFLKSLDSISSYYWKDLNATPGKYWNHYAKLIYKQTKLSGDMIEAFLFLRSRL